MKRISDSAEDSCNDMCCTKICRVLIKTPDKKENTIIVLTLRSPNPVCIFFFVFYLPYYFVYIIHS